MAYDHGQDQGAEEMADWRPGHQRLHMAAVRLERAAQPMRGRAGAMLGRLGRRLTSNSATIGEQDAEILTEIFDGLEMRIRELEGDVRRAERFRIPGVR